MKTIYTKNAPEPLGHYSQAIIHNNTIYLATQIPIDPKGNSNEITTIDQQTKQLLTNIENILLAGNSDLNHIIRITIYITDMNLWDEVNTIYKDFLKDHKPARGIIHVKSIHKGFQVAMDVVAAVKQ